MEPQISYLRVRRYYKTVLPLLKKPEVAAYTMLVLSFFTIAVFGAFAIRPTITTIVQLRKKIEDQTAVYNAMQNKVQQLRVAEVEYASLQSDLPTIFQALPKKPESATLLGKVNRALVDTSVDLVVLQFASFPISTESATSKDEQIQFTLTAKGSYNNILSLVSYLRNTDRIITLDTVDIAVPTSNGTTTTSSDLLTATIKGKAYTLWDK